MTKPNKPIRVSNHAVNRVKERFQLFFKPSELHDLKRTISNIVSVRGFEQEWKRSDFYKNKHGNSEFTLYSGFVFVLVEKEDCYLVVTASRHIHGVGGSIDKKRFK